ncbi:hypothetical protein ABHF91_16535 [Pseudaeromonas sp. ZJS20]|uniref:hypothetical protein n=1 Tax=Pseudaeromonas aegiceratis TaxID=3153928 RepID=UPI00390C6CBC
MNIEDFVCTAPSTASILGLNQCMSEVDVPAPIDYYFKRSREIIGYGTSDRLNEFTTLGGLLLLGLISSAEGYFRSVLSITLDVCPISRNVAAEKQINLGGVLWHGKDEFRRSAFEHMSFASSKEIKSATKGYLGFEMKDSVFSSVLQDYDVVCHLRHGLIHNAGILPGRNAVQMNIKSYSKSVEICIDFSFLQSAAASIDSLVVTFNRALFSYLCNRWATSWRSRADWEPNNEKKKFMQIWNAFFCKSELKHRQNKRIITAASCMKKLKLEYNL